MVLFILIGVTAAGVSYVKERRALKKERALNTASPAPTSAPATQPRHSRAPVHREGDDELLDVAAPPSYENRRGDVVILGGRHTNTVEGVEEEVEPPEYVNEEVVVVRDVKEGIRVG